MFEKKIAMKVPAGVTGASVGGNFYEANKEGVVKVPANHAHSLIELGFSVQGLTEDTIDLEQAQSAINDSLTKKQGELEQLQKAHVAAVDENTKLRTDLDNAQKEIVRLTTNNALSEHDEEKAQLRKDLEAANQEINRLKVQQGKNK